jgi:hypothetical protein
MVDVRGQFVRGDKARERLAARPKSPKIICVNPKDETVRKNIKHPRGIAFRPTGSIEWPDDKFTKRRLRDGTVTLAKDEIPPAKT